MVIPFGSSSSINGSSEMLGWESLLLSYVHSIKDGALRFCHIAREGASRYLICPIMNRRLIFSYGSSNPSHYNSLDKWPGLIHLIKQIVVHSNGFTYPPHLSENEGLRLNDFICINRTLLSVPHHLHN